MSAHSLFAKHEARGLSVYRPDDLYPLQQLGTEYSLMETDLLPTVKHYAGEEGTDIQRLGANYQIPQS